MSNEFSFQKSMLDLNVNDPKSASSLSAFSDAVFMTMNRSKRNRDNIFDQDYLNVTNGQAGGTVFNSCVNTQVNNLARIDKPRPKPQLKYQGKAKSENHREALYDFRNQDKDNDVGRFQDYVRNKTNEIMNVQNTASEIVSQNEFSMTKNIEDFAGKVNVPNYYDVVSHQEGKLKFINALRPQDNRIERNFTQDNYLTDDMRYDDGKLHINLYNGREHLTKAQQEEQQRHLYKTKQVADRLKLQQIADDDFHGRSKIATRYADPIAYDKQAVVKRDYEFDTTEVGIKPQKEKEKFVNNIANDIDDDSQFANGFEVYDDVDYVNENVKRGETIYDKMIKQRPNKRNAQTADVYEDVSKLKQPYSRTYDEDEISKRKQRKIKEMYDDLNDDDLFDDDIITNSTFMDSVVRGFKSVFGIKDKKKQTLNMRQYSDDDDYSDDVQYEINFAPNNILIEEDTLTKVTKTDDKYIIHKKELLHDGSFEYSVINIPIESVTDERSKAVLEFSSSDNKDPLKLRQLHQIVDVDDEEELHYLIQNIVETNKDAEQIRALFPIDSLHHQLDQIHRYNPLDHQYDNLLQESKTKDDVTFDSKFNSEIEKSKKQQHHIKVIKDDVEQTIENSKTTATTDTFYQRQSKPTIHQDDKHRPVDPRSYTKRFNQN